MMITRFRAFSLLAFAVLLGLGSNVAAPASPVISGLSYTPKPLYDDQGFIIVTFKANRAARPGYEFGIVFQIFGKNSSASLGCTPVNVGWDPVLGGSASSHIRSAGTHTKSVKAVWAGDWRSSCRGDAYLTVFEHKIGSSGIGSQLALLNFRVAAAP